MKRGKWRKRKDSAEEAGVFVTSATFSFLHETTNDMYLWLDCVIRSVVDVLSGYVADERELHGNSEAKVKNLTTVIKCLEPEMINEQLSNKLAKKTLV